MMFEISVRAETLEQAREKIAALYSQFGCEKTASTAAVLATNNVAAAPSAPAASPAVSPTKKGRPAKEAKKEEAPSAEPITAGQVSAPATEVVDPSTPITKQEVMQALQKVMKAYTPETAKEILVKVTEQSRLSDVNEKDFPFLMAACNKYLEEKTA